MGSKNGIAAAALAVLAAACASRSDGSTTSTADSSPTPSASASASATTPAPPAAPAPTGSLGTIGGEPFVVASAVADDQGGGVWVVYAYDKKKSCADPPWPTADGEHTVQLTFYNTWTPGTYDLGFEPGAVPATVDVWNVQGDQDRADAGSVEVVSAPTAVLAKASLRLHRVAEPTSGAALDGPFEAVVCPP